MSRISYNDDDNWAAIRWGGAAKRAIEGKLGQRVLRTLRDVLLALPRKRLAYSQLCDELGDYCVLGAYAHHKGLSRTYLEKQSNDQWDEDQPEWAHDKLGITRTLAWELMEKNDEAFGYWSTPEQRYTGVLRWVEAKIAKED